MLLTLLIVNRCRVKLTAVIHNVHVACTLHSVAPVPSEWKTESSWTAIFHISRSCESQLSENLHSLEFYWFYFRHNWLCIIIEFQEVVDSRWSLSESDGISDQISSNFHCLVSIDVVFPVFGVSGHGNNYFSVKPTHGHYTGTKI